MKWREASSLIITAASHFNSSTTENMYTELLEKSNFVLLALKKKGNFLPKHCVFPGGSVSSADSCVEWINLFESFNIKLESFSSNVRNNCSQLPIFKNYNHSNEIPRWLSLRITAIRETFEETGLLICKEFNNLKNISFAEHLQIDSIDLWRNKVIENPYQFIKLCREFKCYPDIEALYTWSNWLAPSSYVNRFDAIFFITTLTKLESLSPDNFEIESVEWCSPEKLLSSNKNNEILFYPPQYYEITRLQNIAKLDEIIKFISSRTTHEGCRWMPVPLIAENGVISLLPGDAMYPHNVELYKPVEIRRDDELVEDLRCAKMHRIEHMGLNMKLVIENMDGDSIVPEWTCSKL